MSSTDWPANARRPRGPRIPCPIERAECSRPARSGWRRGILFLDLDSARHRRERGQNLSARWHVQRRLRVVNRQSLSRAGLAASLVTGPLLCALRMPWIAASRALVDLLQVFLVPHAGQNLAPSASVRFRLLATTSFLSACNLLAEDIHIGRPRVLAITGTARTAARR